MPTCTKTNKGMASGKRYGKDLWGLVCTWKKCGKYQDEEAVIMDCPPETPNPCQYCGHTVKRVKLHG